MYENFQDDGSLGGFSLGKIRLATSKDVQGLLFRSQSWVSSRCQPGCPNQIPHERRDGKCFFNLEEVRKWAEITGCKYRWNETKKNIQFDEMMDACQRAEDAIDDIRRLLGK